MLERLNRLLTFKRARSYATVLVAVYAVAWVYVVATGSPPLNSAGEPIGGDYIAFHTAGRLLLTGRGSELYDHAAVAEAQSELLDGRIPGFYDAFRNPPFAALPFVPLALLDLLPGFGAWTLVSLACLALALKLLLDEVPSLRARWRGLVLLVLAFAPVYFGLIDGENATVSLLLYVLIYRALVRDQDGLAGVWAAVGLFKPQLFFIFPLIFVASRRWRALETYVVTAAALAGLSLALVGFDGMQAWLRVLLDAESVNAAANAWRMMSLKAFFDLLLPGQTVLAAGLYALVVCVVLVGVWRLWRGHGRCRETLPSVWATTLLAAILVDPHLVDYDLTPLVCGAVIGALWLPDVKWWVVLLYMLVLVRGEVSLAGSGIQLAAPLLMLLLVLAWRVSHLAARVAPEPALSLTGG